MKFKNTMGCTQASGKAEEISIEIETVKTGP
jgi:hypothetical protein